MLEFVNVLMSILVIEGVLLVTLGFMSLMIILRQMYESKESVKNFKNYVKKFKQKVYSNEKYSNVCKAMVVLYGITKLTALWCFSILFGLVFISNIWAVIGLLILEILVIALQVRNKFILNKEDTINVSWLLIRIERFVQKTVPNFSFRGCYEKMKDSIQVRLNKKYNV